MKNTHEYNDKKKRHFDEKKITARSGLRAPDLGLQGGFPHTLSLQSGKFDSVDNDSLYSGQMFRENVVNTQMMCDSEDSTWFFFHEPHAALLIGVPTHERMIFSTDYTDKTDICSIYLFHLLINIVRAFGTPNSNSGAVRGRKRSLRQQQRGDVGITAGHVAEA